MKRRRATTCLLALPVMTLANTNASANPHAGFAAAAPPAPATAGGGAMQAFTQLLQSVDEQQLRLDPQAALLRGDRRHAHDFGDYLSDEHVAEVRHITHAHLRRAQAIAAQELPPLQRLALEVLTYQLSFTLRGHDEGVVRLRQRLPVDHLFGHHLGFAQLSSGEGSALYETLDDYEAGLSRIQGFVTWVARAIEMMRRGLHEGVVQPRVVVVKVIAQLEQALAQGDGESPYLKPLAKLPASISATDGERLRRAYRQALQDEIRPALARLLDFMREPYLGRSRGDPPGLATLPGAERLYAHALEEFNTTRMSAAEIHALGVAEVARIGDAMQRIRRQVGFAGTLAEFISHVQHDAAFKFASEEALLTSYQQTAERIAASLPRHFAQLPQARLEVRPVPREQQSSAGGAYYIPGTADGARPGVFYVNTSDLPTRLTTRTTALLLHEAMPGHHLQGMLTVENAALPPLLRFNWNAGFGEGWALYCEWLGHEMGLYDDPYQAFGQLELEMIRSARLVVDTGLHALAWSRERACAYMLEHTSLDRAAVEQEVDRYTVWPGQATAYKVGDVFIRRMRARAEQSLGTGFDLREFHRELLSAGTPPLAVLERRMADWARAQRPA